MPRTLRPIALFLSLLAPVCSAAQGTAAPEGAFPLPSIDGKALALTQGQKTFRVPMRYARVEQFYKEQFLNQKDVRLVPSGTDGDRTLTLTSKRKGDAWTRAVVREGKVDTSVEVVAVLRMSGEAIEGNGKPLVQFVLTRSPDAAKAAAEMNHLEHP